MASSPVCRRGKEEAEFDSKGGFFALLLLESNRTSHDYSIQLGPHILGLH